MLKGKTLFPVLVLYLIKEQPDHGFGITQRVRELCGTLTTVNTNQIYDLLRNFEERGFVSAEWEHPTKRSHRIYSITKEGAARLKQTKALLVPYLETFENSLTKLRKNLYR